MHAYVCVCVCGVCDQMHLIIQTAKKKILLHARRALMFIIDKQEIEKDSGLLVS